MTDSIFSFAWLIAVPLVAAAVVSVLRDTRHAHRLGVGAAVITAGLSMAAWIGFTPNERGLELDGFRPLGAPLFGIDALGALCLPFVSVLAIALLIGGPARERNARDVATVLATLASLLAALLALHVATLLVAFVAVVVPCTWHAQREESGSVAKVARLLLAGAAVPAAFFFVGLAFFTGRPGIDLMSLGSIGLDRSAEVWLFVPLVLAILVRMAVVPFHAWLPVLLERGALSTGLLVSTSTSGAYLFVRIMLPLFERELVKGQPIVAAIALASALYAALIALSKERLRSLAAYLLMSQSALVLAGLATLDASGAGGAYELALAEGIAGTGLLLVASAIESRIGRRAFSELGGLSKTMPALGATFLVFGLAAVAFPGFASFIGHDLVLTALAHRAPLLGLGFALVGVLNAVAVFRAYTAVFLGAPRSAIASRGIDLRPRERVVAIVLAGILFFFGLAPDRALDGTAPVDEAARQASDRGDHATPSPEVH